MDQEGEQQWDESKILKTVGQTKYKINRQIFLGRGAAGIIFHGSRLYSNKQSDVAIKQYIGSSNWGSSQSKWNNQLKFIKQTIKKAERQKLEYFLPIYDIFYANNCWYMVSQYCKLGSLNDRIKQIKQDENKIYDFCLKLANVLKNFHEGVNREKSNTSRKQKIMHRNIKPSNIVYSNGQKDSKNSKLYLIDFELAKIVDSDEKEIIENVGTELYKAPQVKKGKYNLKVDIWGFGVTLYELMNGGEKLFTYGAISLNLNEKEKYIEKKLIELYKKMKFAKKILYASFWMQLLRGCLAINPNDRWSSKQLVDFLKNNESNKLNQAQKYDQKQQKMKKKIENAQIIQINFETLRMNYLQDKIFTLFQYVALHPGQISRFLFYVLLKYLCSFIMERGSKVKEKAKIVKEEKYNYFKKLIEQKRIQQIRIKSTQKIRNQVQQLKSQNGLQFQKISKTLQLFPEILSHKVRQTRKLFYEFAYHFRKQIQSNITFRNVIGQMINGMDDMDQYKIMLISEQQAESNNIELVSFKKLDKFLSDLEQRNKKPAEAIERCQKLIKRQSKYQ